MACLLKVLSYMLQSLSHFLISTYIPNQKSNSAPPIWSIWRHRVHLTQPLTETLVTSISPIGISVSPRWDCNLFISLRNISFQPRWAISPIETAMQTLCFPFVTFWPLRDERIGPTEFAWPTLYLTITKIVPPRLRYALTLMKSVPPSWHVGPTENPNGHIICWIGPTEFHDSVPPRLVSCV